MTNLTRKRSTLVAIVIIVALFSVTILIQFDGKTSPPVGSDTTTTSTMSSSTTTSLTQQKSTSISSSSATVSTIMKLGEAYSSLFATPNVTLNYSIVISEYEPTGSHVTLSAKSTIPGVALTLNPEEFTFLGTQEPVGLGISVAPTVNSSILPVEIIASTANSSTNSTFDFRLNKALAVILINGSLTPTTLHVSVGQAVTWLNIADNSDENGWANVVFSESSAPSPTMYLNDVWSHTFDKSGTYHYQVIVAGYPTTSGIVVVA
jgi:plastocyanin